ncbi:hypothetical protein SDC9_140402 [bioreactor metagenome]|uniref:Uncharacterized protein n=1 Tax=bioreactor metagenome TaxID=1076179 RepID=A0A645DV85_9ZZZZ
MAHVPRRTVLVVGHGLYENRDPFRPVSFISHFAVRNRAVFTRRFLYDPLDVVVGHIVFLRLDNRVS